ncbi:WXG100 family type VII secretion target [Nocardia veterana]|uniref:WXG100 family type VII secretion target n=1 Tax=Nocardia veterana TaxID=132249 RepID=A0A7X6RHW9_9NOCA|nr:WXG100 family type VII secretion target [Nocardia veterana]NKY86480.1 WXG100 family type VII secretion target [Nocardia veterana]
MVDFFADPERLRAIAPKFEQLGEDVETALEKLRRGLEAEGRCWGGDRPGTEFEKNYPQEGDGSVKQTLDELAALAATLRETGNKITGTANLVQNQDQASADGIRKV